MLLRTRMLLQSFEYQGNKDADYPVQSHGQEQQPLHCSHRFMCWSIFLMKENKYYIGECVVHVLYRMSIIVLRVCINSTISAHIYSLRKIICKPVRSQTLHSQLFYSPGLKNLNCLDKMESIKKCPMMI